MPEAVEISSTTANLLTAFEDEVNARCRYNAYSVKADVEGLHGIASLCRALARAEETHAENHAKVIKGSGGQVRCEVHSFPVGQTLENLRIALGGELYECETLYPTFLENAEIAKNNPAIRTFRFAMQAEKSHAKLFRDVIELTESANTDSWIAVARNFYVCPVCGYISEAREMKLNCPVCAGPQRQFEQIN